MPQLSKKSYSSRLLKHARRETRKHLNVELIVSTIVGFAVGSMASGLSWAGAARGIGYGALAFVAIIGVAFLIHLILSPRGLDIESQEETAKLEDDYEQSEANLKPREP